MSTLRQRLAEPQRFHLDKRAGFLLSLIESGASPHPEAMTTPQAADFYGVSVAWLEISRSRGVGPPFVHVTPRVVRYIKSKQVPWLRQRRKLYESNYTRR